MEPNGVLVVAPLAPSLTLDEQEESKAHIVPQETPSGDPKENEEATLDVLTEKVDTLEKETDALEEEVYVLQRGATLQGKVKDLQEKQGVLDTNLQEKEIALQDGATQEKAEDLKGKRGVLETNHWEKEDALQDGATTEKVEDLQQKHGVLSNVDPVPHSGDTRGMALVCDHKELYAQRKRLYDLKKKLRAMLKKPHVFQILFDDLRNKLNALQQKLNALQKEFNTLQGATTREKAKDLQGKQEVQATMDPPVPPSGDQEEKEAVALDALRENNDTLQKELDALQNLLDLPRKELDVQLKGLNALLKDLTPLRKELDGWRKELNALLKELSALQKELSALQKELSVLQRGATREKAKDLQGKQGVQATMDPPVPPSGDQKAEEVTLDALQENMDGLQKGVDDLKGSDGATQEKVVALQEQWEIQMDELYDIMLEKLSALEVDAEILWNDWFQNTFRNLFLRNPGLPQENVNYLKYYLLMFLQNMSIVKKVDELHDALQEERSVPCHGLGDALWEKVKELDFALWDINLYTIDELQDLVDAFSDALKEGSQEEMGALLEKLEAMQDFLRLVPLKKLSALREITGVLHDAMLDFPRDVPAQEKQDALWDALQDVSLKEMCDLWGKVRTLWGFPLKMFAVWEKVYTLNIFLQAGSRNRVCNLQEHLEALKDAVRDALLWEEMGINQDSLTALWASVQDFPLNELGALEDKLNALKERLWNIPKENLFPPKESVDASQIVLDSPHSVSQGELSEIPEEEVDALQRIPAEEESTEADISDSLPAWKTPDTGPGLLSVTQQGDLSKMKEEISLNVEQEISLTSSQPEDLGRAKGQERQENEELICEESFKASPEPLHK